MYNSYFVNPIFIKNALRGERAFFNKEVVMFYIIKDEKKVKRFRFLSGKSSKFLAFYKLLLKHIFQSFREIKY